MAGQQMQRVKKDVEKEKKQKTTTLKQPGQKSADSFLHDITEQKTLFKDFLLHADKQNHLRTKEK